MIAGAPSIAHALQAAFAATPERPSLVGPYGDLTFGTLAGATGALAARLRESGVARQEPVAIWSARRDRVATAILAAMQSGMVACPLDPRMPTLQLSDLLLRTGVRTLLADEDFSTAELSPELRGSLRIVRFGAGGATGTFIDDTLMPDDSALLLFTSGSTGAPKGIRLSHGNLLANAAGVIERTGLSPADRLLHVMPLHHTNGINNQLLAPLLVGATVALMPGFSMSEIRAQIARYAPTYLTGVPTMFSRMLALPREDLVGAGMRMLRCGSAPITEDLHRAIEAHFGLPLVVSYGLSEATCTSLMNPPERRRIGSVGTPLKGQTVAVFRPGTWDEVAAGAEGEICIAGPTVMQGYVPAGSDPDERTVENRWLRSGDLGRRDSDGYVFVTGRLKEIILRGGENISPGAVESALLSHPGITAAAVVGIPHRDLGEVPAAFLVVAGRLDAERVRSHVRARVGQNATPEHVFFLEALPENAIGKLDRKEMRRLACARLGIQPDGTGRENIPTIRN